MTNIPKFKDQWPASAIHFFTLAVLCIPSIAHAYVGPNIGITLLSALVTVFAAIFIGLAGIMFWPIRAWLRRRSRAGQAAEDHGRDGEAAPEAAEDPQPIAAEDDARVAEGQSSRRRRGGA